MVVYNKLNIQESSINQKSNKTMLTIPCTGATFVKRNFCIVAGIASFDTAGLHLVTFRILEPYPSKDIELDLNRVI